MGDRTVTRRNDIRLWNQGLTDKEIKVLATLNCSAKAGLESYRDRKWAGRTASTTGTYAEGSEKRKAL